ncbi:MAG TPA: SIR2 family protein [Alphaproteobacteria bacterium]|nr:SIR2 family protein [Alphaproteobacteria bacterium]
MQIENEATFRLSAQSGLNLFLGAGFSLLSSDANDRHLPVGDQLKDELIREFRLEEMSKLRLSQVCAYLERTNKLPYLKYLKQRFTVKAYDNNYGNIENINVKNIFTTNIDDLILNIYKNSTFNYINVVSMHGSEHLDRSAINYVPLHGSVVENEPQFYFSDADMASAFAEDPDKWKYLSKGLEDYPTVFCGYGLNDAGVWESLSSRQESGRGHKSKWILVNDADAGTEEYFSAIDFQIIRGDTEELLSYFSQLELDDELRQKRQSNFVPGYSIPQIGDVSVRPLRDFYEGAGPTWYDILSGQLSHTAHFNNAQNKINNKENVVILGIPACGKTTLMMQLAAEVAFDGQKFFVDYCTEEKANHIVNAIKGRKSLIFVDDFTDSVTGILILLKCPNIQILAADRSYIFDTVTHLMDLRKISIIDVTELRKIDIQRIYDNIPNDFRSEKFALTEEEGGQFLSIFEIIELNIRKTKLSERFIEVLEGLRESDIRLHDVFF